MKPEQVYLSPNQFRQEYKNELQNKRWLNDVELQTQGEILGQMEFKLERMKSQEKISSDHLKELEDSQAPYDQRQKEKEALKGWQTKIQQQEEAIQKTKDRVELLEWNLLEITINLKKAELIK